MGTYGLGVDLGTTYTAAAAWRDGRAEAVPLGQRAHTVPSVLFLREDGVLQVGEAAVRAGRCTRTAWRASSSAASVTASRSCSATTSAAPRS